MKHSIRVKPTLIDRALYTLGYVRATHIKQARTAFQSAMHSRLNSDWITSGISADQELKTSLRVMRQRSRKLLNDNDYASGFANMIRNNVMGSNGIKLQVRVEDKNGELADKTNQAIEDAFAVWGKKENCCANGRMTWIDAQWLFVRSLLSDGEVFIQKRRGYPKSAHFFALQFIDPDQVDHTLNKPRDFGVISGANGGTIATSNEIRMGVEVDEDFRAVAYYVLKTHPSEPGPKSYIRVPAEDMIHAYMFRRANDTRGVPWLHTAMERLWNVQKFEESELVATRIAAAKMGFFTSKTGEDFQTEKKEDGTLEITVEPGSFQQLPEGVDFKPWDPQHPNVNQVEFVKLMIRAVAVGVGMSYNAFARDYEKVNFSSLRAATLEDRELYKCLQKFCSEHFHEDVYNAWLPMAITSGELKLPTLAASNYTNVVWRPRGWPWVNPLQDAQAYALDLQNNISTLEDTCAEQGSDWREVLRQRAKEVELTEQLGLSTLIGTQKPKAPGSGSQPDGDLEAEGQPNEEDEGKAGKEGK